MFRVTLCQHALSKKQRSDSVDSDCCKQASCLTNTVSFYHGSPLLSKGSVTLKNISLLFRHYSPLGAVVWMLNSPERPKHERVGMGVLLVSDGHFERQGLMEGKPW